MYIDHNRQMIEEQIIGRGIQDSRLIEAISSTPRELFVPKDLQNMAYEDCPLPIGYNQTISQPFIVAFMTEEAQIQPDNKVLEIGTGSGYQAAILSKLCKEVYSIECVVPLGKTAKHRLHELGYQNVHIIIGNGYEGLPKQSPFDVIIVTAAPDDIPSILIDQLKEGARLIIPVGGFDQQLMRITKTKQGIYKETLIPVRFVPMVNSNIK